ncbi:MAG: MFS transporter, partial [Candidatus Lokiarchaeota archaeon]|nr:MFS transporter [Candidatus Lokiarchaeota archaeon]MBD3202563.1 MFS transporter [Candidatus Lokiarchaeota archaeon]
FIAFHLISGVLIPFFVDWGGLEFVEIMFLQSYFTTMILVFEIPCGAISDYISKKFSLILGAIVNTFATLVYSIYPHIILFVLGETLWAFSAALISGTDESLIYKSLRKQGKENKISVKTARMRAFALLGIGISAPFGSLIAEYISLNAVMFYMMIPFIGAAIISLTIKEPNHDLKEVEKQKYLDIIKSGFKELRYNKILRVLAFEFVSVQAIVFFIIWTYQLYLEQIGVILAFFGFFSALMTFTQILIINLIPSVEKRYKNKRLFIQLYTLIPAVAFILMAFVSYIPISILLILLVIGFGFSRSILFVNGINRQIQTENRATALSTINMITSLVQALFYPLIGYLVMWNLNATFIVLGIAILMVIALSRIKNEYI